MIVDFRYHVASLVAVFVALGLGVILGLNIGKTASRQLSQQLERLEQTYQKIREEHKVIETNLQAKTKELEVANQFQRAIIPRLTANKLLGRRIAILRTNETVDFKYAQQLVDALRQAGAEVTSITTVTRKWNSGDAKYKTELENALGLAGANTKKLMGLSTARLAQTLVQGQNSTVLSVLQSKELLQLWGDYHRGYIDTIIVLGGSQDHENDRQQVLDLYLLDAFRKAGVRLYGVEPATAPISYMRLYQSKCTGTVDNIEMPAGATTLVYLLASGRRGFYGVKETARSLFPDFKAL
jgi:hypothetical protein